MLAEPSSRHCSDGIRQNPGVPTRRTEGASAEPAACDAEEERRVLDELVRKYVPMRTMTAEERAAAIARNPMMSRMSTLRIDPSRRS